ncbi:SAG family member [Eimeria mitis]|uniref:SAG family member n=1 Tax=Eimeria mitis TaxID=44415 RepID=U6JNA7_9EIME|nr:SAG family member [Eimeria mitis]CDJ26999.1 SAG family member [Eimeria mitis]
MSVRIGVLTENSDLAEGLKTETAPTKKTKFVAQLPESEDQKYREAVQNALQAGLDINTHLDVYGPLHKCENVFDIFRFCLNFQKKTKFLAELTGTAEQKYREAVQNALQAGLEALPSYPEDDGGWTTFWQKPAGANLARLLSSKSTKVGCGVGTCTEGGGEELRTAQKTVTFLVCEMQPAAVANEAPFDKEYYEALKERKTLLTAMTDEDLKAPVQGGAAAAVPSLLVAGLTAIVAFASA